MVYLFVHIRYKHLQSRLKHCTHIFTCYEPRQPKPTTTHLGADGLSNFVAEGLPNFLAEGPSNVAEGLPNFGAEGMSNSGADGLSSIAEAVQ